jgi:hypothetical protein
VQGESVQPVVLDSGPATLTFGFASSATGPIVMHRAPSGLYVELVDRSLREVLFGRDLAVG